MSIKTTQDAHRVTDPERVIAELWIVSKLLDVVRSHQDEGTFPNGATVNINYGSGTVRIRAVFATGERRVLDLLSNEPKPGITLLRQVAAS